MESEPWTSHAGTVKISVAERKFRLKQNSVALFFLCMISIGGLGFAQEQTAIDSITEPFVSPDYLDLTRELVIFGAGTALWATGAIAIGGLDPLTAEEIFALDPEDVNKFDRASIGMRRTTQAGDALVHASILLPLTFLTFGDTRRDFGILAVMSVEVIVMNQGLNWMAKGLSRRTRPFVYEPESPFEDKTKTNARLSFYSGHTSTAASMTFFTAKVFSDYLSNKTAKALIWTAAAVYPALVGYLRRDSANHFRTDVITGYIVGALIGYGIPLLHKTKNKDLSVSPMISFDHIGLALRYRF